MARFGEILISKKLITQQQLDDALAEQKASENHQLIGQILINRGYITYDERNLAVTEQFDD